MAPRLQRTYLPNVQAHLLSPTWTAPQIGIVHLGLGNFHRAHQAIYTEEAVIRAGGDWGISGVTLQGSTIKRDALNEQDGLFSVIQRDEHGDEMKIVRILQETLALPYDWPQVFERLTDPNVRVVSLTVTEKGYCRRSSGGLQSDHPLILHDLRNPQTPKSVPGIILAGLHGRKGKGILPFTSLPCDNISANGQALRRVVLDLARLVEEVHSAYQGLASWVETHCKFPSTMVDRIVPASTEVDKEEVVEKLSLVDYLPVSCEPFRQWVIEDNFSNGRPAWEGVGAQLVSDVTPFELAKLRMLNAAHSTLAYFSLLLGLQTIDEAISHHLLKPFLYDMLTEEVIPILVEHVPVELDLHRYRDDLLRRFANPSLKHQTIQIAADGSQKVPQRLLTTISECVASNKPFSRLACSVAAWMICWRCHSDDGTSFSLQDPMSAQLRAAYDTSKGNPQSWLEEMNARVDVFPSGLAANPTFRDAIVKLLGSLQKGVETTLGAHI
jgi:fructuronate reductase